MSGPSIENSRTKTWGKLSPRGKEKESQGIWHLGSKRVRNKRCSRDDRCRKFKDNEGGANVCLITGESLVTRGHLQLKDRDTTKNLSGNCKLKCLQGRDR